MVFANRSELIGSLWLLLKPVQNEIGRKASLAIVVVIPVLAAFTAALDAPRTKSESIVGAFLNLLEPIRIELPLNLLRVFWASVLFYLSSVLYEMARPSVLNCYEKWSRSGDFSNLSREIKSRQNSISEGELEQQLHDIHKARSVQVISFGTLALCGSAIAVLLSAYLITVVVALNVARVWESCSIWTVFSVNSDSCYLEEGGE